MIYIHPRSVRDLQKCRTPLEFVSDRISAIIRGATPAFLTFILYYKDYSYMNGAEWTSCFNPATILEISAQESPSVFVQTPDYCKFVYVY